MPKAAKYVRSYLNAHCIQHMNYKHHKKVCMKADTSKLTEI